MYRFLFRTVSGVRSASLGIIESTTLPATCAQATVSKFANGGGVKAISTGSARLCEKKDDVVPSNQDEKTNAGVKTDPTESPTSATSKAEDDITIVKTAEQTEETLVLKTDDGGTTETEAEPRTVNPVPAKKENQDLLNLLGTMKVSVTSKRKSRLFDNSKDNDLPIRKPNRAPLERTTSMFQKAIDQTSSKSETLDSELVSAASAAASTLPDPSKAKSELLRQLKQQESLTKAQKKGDLSNLSTIIADMKVGTQSNRRGPWKTSQIRYDDEDQDERGLSSASQTSVKTHLLKSSRLNIFSPTAHKVESAVARPTLWEVDFAHQLSVTFKQLPRNSLEEMIQWSKEGKLWQYPINNEAGLEEEASVPFHEHIFLEKHLDEGFPRQGPVRHFMELVLVGLSKNPYLTVEQKKEHISWFRDYFQQKGDILEQAHLN